MSHISDTPTFPRERELDNCAICGGYRGGVPGNGNRIEGLAVCDYCTARRPPMPTGLVSAKTVAMYNFGLKEQLILLAQNLYDPSADVGTADGIIGRMHKLLIDLCQLPPITAEIRWQETMESLPEPEAQLLVAARNGAVKESTGAVLRELAQAALHDGEECCYTHWAVMPTSPQAGLGRIANPSAQSEVTVYGKAMTAHDAGEVATFVKALRDNACPYCARTIRAGKEPAQKPDL
jgi:hypothetical protein